MKSRKTSIVLLASFFLTIGAVGIVAADAGDEFTAMEADQGTFIKLNEGDPSRDIWKGNRDTSQDPKREPGPIHINRNIGGMAYIGIPTFFKMPVALTPEDLKAGKVDVAIMGASLDMSSGRRGAAFGPNSLRTAANYTPWGSMFHQTSEATMIEIFNELVVVDYGDAPIDFLSVERSIGPVHDMVKGIAETGAIPIIVGGDHSLMYPDVVALTDVYGKGNVGVVHFDAHIDGEEGGLGHYLTHGSPVRKLIDEGHIKGENFIQIGLRSWIFSDEMLAWMREKGVRYHFMTEIVEKGWDEVMDAALAEAANGAEYLFISFDLDALDPAFAPGAGTPEPGGLTPREIFPIIRGLCAQNRIVGFEMVELNPLVDVGRTTALVADRILREALNGIAMYKKGMTDPKYLHPEILNNR
jgi:formimidoylglutamase